MTREKNVRLTPSMNLSFITAPDYGKMCPCPNFWFWEIQFIQSQAWTWSYLGASQCLCSNERPGICYPLIFPEPEVRTHLPIIRDWHGAQIHCRCQPDIFFLLAFSMTRRGMYLRIWFNAALWLPECVISMRKLDRNCVEGNYDGETFQFGLFDSFYRLHDDIVRHTRRCVR